MLRKKVVILIPTHRPSITQDDEISLMHLKKYLKKYDTFFVLPKSVSSREFIKRGFKVKKVNNNFFGTLRRNNEMYLSSEFYKEFKDYMFMLIYQLDALVF